MAVASIWSYENKRVLVSGGGGSGMGAATVRDLLELGAEVHVFDMKEPTADVASYTVGGSSRSRQAIDAAVADLGGRRRPVQLRGTTRAALFGLDTMLVNFVAARHLTSRVGRSDAVGQRGGDDLLRWGNGLGAHDRDGVGPLLETPGYEEAKAWCEANPELVGRGLPACPSR